MWGRGVSGQEGPKADHPSQHPLHPFPGGFSLTGTCSQGGSSERSESCVWKTFPQAEGLLESFPLTTSLILLLHRAWGGLFSLSILLWAFFFFPSILNKHICEPRAEHTHGKGQAGTGKAESPGDGVLDPGPSSSLGAGVGHSVPRHIWHRRHKWDRVCAKDRESGIPPSS